jgi:hypothetical protein
MNNMNNNKKANEVIKEILGRDIEWYDYQKLKSDARVAYYNEAQKMLRGEVFNNEIKSFVTDLMKEIAMNSENFDKVIALRFSINALEAFRERLEMISDPTRSEDKENLTSAI